MPVTAQLQACTLWDKARTPIRFHGVVILEDCVFGGRPGPRSFSMYQHRHRHQTWRSTLKYFKAPFFACSDACPDGICGAARELWEDRRAPSLALSSPSVLVHPPDVPA